MNRQLILNRNNSRRKTHKIVNGAHGMNKFEIKNKSCKKCGAKENLEIHHEIYPTCSWGIKEAISKGKIYYLCCFCHKKEHKN